MEAAIIKKCIYAPAKMMKRFLPGRLLKSMEYKSYDLIRQQFPESKQDLLNRADQFVLRELAIIFWGILFAGLMTAGVTLYGHYHPEQVSFTRNSYGDGDTEVSLTLQKGKEKENIDLSVDELSISDDERDELFESGFKEAIKQMLGNNSGVECINQDLNFEESIEGYPFTVYYYVKNSEYIKSSGTLGDAVCELQEGETLQTEIDITLSYNGYKKEKSCEVILFTPKKEESEGAFDSVITKLRSLEEESRQKKEVDLPTEYEGTKISIAGAGSERYAMIILGVSVFVFLAIHNYTKLKEEAGSVRKSTVKDFPDIVHYLTLYMGAGLSFASAVSRITADYQSGAYGFKDRYAYEQIVRMDQQLKTGSSQKEACLRWGNQFQEKMYQKLALMLIQSFSKGAKEAGMMLEQVRKDAFRQYIDQAKILGEEASTKLLFPMIVLMGIVMLIVMAPAIVQFQVM